MKIGVVIVTHYQIGQEFLHALRLIVPNTPEFLSVSIDPKQSVDEMRQLIERALKQANNVQSHAAELLGIGKSGLNQKIKKYKLEVGAKE